MGDGDGLLEVKNVLMDLVAVWEVKGDAKGEVKGEAMEEVKGEAKGEVKERLQVMYASSGMKPVLYVSVEYLHNFF